MAVNNHSDPLPAADRQRLRDLARKQVEYAHLPVMQERRNAWYQHNDLAGSRPMVQIEMWTFADEILPQRLTCQSEKGRQVEAALLQNMLNFELFDDDLVVPPFFPITMESGFQLFNLAIEREYVQDQTGRAVGHRFHYPIHDLSEELPRLEKTKWWIDPERGQQKKAYLESIFGDILPIRRVGRSLVASLTQHIVHLMGMESMFMAMYDTPDELHGLMRRITDDYLAYFRDLEKQEMILATNCYAHVSQGSWGFTHDLPGPSAEGMAAGEDAGSVSISHSWGYMDSQETVGISPDMFKDFFFPYYHEIGQLFGLLSYGCCEPVDAIWDNCLNRFDNLRKVSISPWCDQEKMGERLRGSRTIFHRKPSPNYLGVGRELDEAGFAGHMRETARAARGCGLEVSMRDIYTLSGNLDKARRAIAMTRDIFEQEWHR